jgi:hypothetical protein
MAYTTPPTFVSGDPLTAAQLNVLTDDIVYLAGIAAGVTFSGTQVSRAADQSIADGVAEYISFSAESFDYGGWWSTGTTVTVPAGAIPAGFTTIALLVFGRIRYDDDATGHRRIALHKNGSAFGSKTVDGTAGEVTDLDISDVVTVVAGDTIKLEAYQTAGHSLHAHDVQMTVVRYAPVA